MTKRFSFEKGKLVDTKDTFTGAEVKETLIDSLNFINDENEQGETEEKIALLIATGLEIDDYFKKEGRITSKSSLVDMINRGFDNPEDNFEEFANLDDEDDYEDHYEGKIVTPFVIVYFKYVYERSFYNTVFKEVFVEYGDLEEESKKEEEKQKQIKEDTKNFFEFLKGFQEEYGRDSAYNIFKELDYGNISVTSVMLSIVQEDK